ncbi:MAG: 50S ribosomal protein L11 methyltransferase, partial [Bacteroidaceae bacterium]|nr:50S ribosomal protein L11 methyltransferase [Bacteroidaceae bacterium]
MKYLEYRFDITPANSDMQDVLSAVLGEVGFESFVPTEDGENPLFAYVQSKNLDKEMLRAAIENFPVPGVTIDFTYTEAEDKDWNKVWEENYFKP